MTTNMERNRQIQKANAEVEDQNLGMAQGTN